jgi:hypothetical protein
MNRFSSIDNINRKYRNSQVVARGSVIGGYPSSYTPPAPSVVLGTNVIGNVGGTVVRPATGFRSSYVGRTSVPAGFPQGAQVIRVEEPAQVIYHQPQQAIATPVQHTTTTVTRQGVLPPAPAPVDVPVVSRPVNPARAPIRKSLVGSRGSGCPWWCWLIFGILALLLLLGVLAGLWAYLTK